MLADCVFQSTDCDLTEEEEEDVVPSVSFAEFLKQYQELIDWLNQAQRNTQRTVNSLSEKYLNQVCTVCVTLLVGSVVVRSTSTSSVPCV